MQMVVEVTAKMSMSIIMKAGILIIGILAFIIFSKIMNYRKYNQ